MNNQNEIQALENHLKAANNSKLKLHQYIVEDKRKTVNKYYIQLGKATISPALNYNDMNHFIFGMTRAKQIQSEQKTVISDVLDTLYRLEEVYDFDETSTGKQIGEVVNILQKEFINQ
jgi:hypothetical protein